jgi:hypothetical protein
VVLLVKSTFAAKSSNTTGWRREFFLSTPRPPRCVGC